MLTGDLDPALLRAKYLPSNAVLPPAWQGPQADERLALMIAQVRETAQTLLSVRFCLERVLTYPDPALVLGEDYEIEGEPLMYQIPAFTGTYHRVTLPFSPVRSIQRVRMFAGTPVQSPAEGLMLTLEPRWINFNAKVGILRIVPPVLGARGWPTPSLGVPPLSLLWGDTPGVWAVDYTVGLGRIPYDIARWIGLTTARQVLSLAGLDISRGASQISLTMDGITQSQGYGSSQYGPFGPAIATIDKELEFLCLDKLRAAHKGIKIGAF